MTDDRHRQDFSVRDYECDLQGVVNNAVYLHYLEHARHEFLKSRGMDFAEMTKAGIFPVVVRAEIDYRTPLRSGDGFRVMTDCERVSKVRFAFRQEIRRLDDERVVLEATIVGTVLNEKGRPRIPEQFAKMISGGAQ